MSFETALAIALATIGSAVLAGISWNTIGIWQTYRDQGLKAVDWAKVQKNVIIGVILGVIAYGASLSGSVAVPAIVDFNSFILAVIAFFPLVVVAEKIFTRKRPKSAVESAKTPTSD